MRKMIVAIVAIVVSMMAEVSAQSGYVVRDVGAVEVELGVGLATAANRMSEYGKSRQGVDANVELRYNFAAQPVDLGLYASVCSIYRCDRVGDYAKSYKFVSENLLLTSDYNFFQGGKVSPFVGLGVGVAWSDIAANDRNGGTHFTFMPRVGVELSHHLRLTVSYKVFDRANNHLTLSLGYAFGGGRR